MDEPRRRRLNLPIRRPRWRVVLTGVVLLILLIAAIIWSQRVQIATGFITDELKRRGVKATYRVTRIGFSKQRLEDVVIGDPQNPDLTARLVEVETSLGLGGISIDLIRARGVRMVGRITEGGVLTLGEVDKLLPPRTGAPFRFPDQAVDVADAAIALVTPAGRLGIGVAGRGNLADGFRGEIALRSAGMNLSGCRLADPTAYGRIAINDRSPTFSGPLHAASMRCTDGISIDDPHLGLNVTLPETFDRWRGEADVAADRLVLAETSVTGLSGKISFGGDAELTRGAADLTFAGVQAVGFRTGRTNIDGRYAFSPDKGDISLVADASARGITGGSAAIGPITQALASADGTPLEPLAEALSGAVRRAAQGFDASGSLRFVDGQGYGALRIEEMTLASRSGADLGFSGGQGLTYYWPGGNLKVDGEFGLTGGGLPATRMSLRRESDGAMTGTARIAPYSAGNARLALAPVAFRSAPDGTTRIQTTANLSGPFNDGYVQGLTMPIAATFGNGGFSLGEGCVTASFQSLQAAGLRIGPTRLPLCPTGRALIWKTGNGPVRGGAEMRNPRLTGRLGNTPIGMTASRLRFDLDGPGFNSSDVAIRLGRPGSVNRLDVTQLTGRFTEAGVVGTFAGGSGKLANVPLLMSEMRGNWRVIGGDVSVDGGVTVADELDPPRFWPLRSEDFRLTLVDNQIAASGWLNDPETGTPITDVTIAHNLNTGAGNAQLDVPGITFDIDGYQPEELTRLTTGVVALVDGTLTGRGQINWSPQGTTSTGTFSTTDMDLAAPFGPVEGLTTTIEFTDLLGLTSAPGQIANVDLIRTGIDVVDGTIRYQLLPDLKVRVESGRWPFMGGILVLEETILDFSVPSTKRLTFRVIGLDAAVFVREMEFKVIEATGIFDGVLPMEFGEGGGRIVNGRLEARPPGGTLAYVGEVSEEALGTFGKMAFDALRSLRYDKFIINLDGYLAGEFLAEIELDGINRNTNETGGLLNSVLAQLDNIPFEFNISIRGPFRALIATARSLNDPTDLIQPVLPEALQGLPTEARVIREEEETEVSEPLTSIEPIESEGVE